MNDKTVRFTVALSIAEGKLEAFEAIAQTMVAGSKSEGTLGLSGGSDGRRS